MGEPYIGEIRMFAGNFPPNGWMFCAGQLLPISGNDVLFQLIGTTYGGDGQSTFALPNLQSRVPIHMGTSPLSGTTYQIGESGGVESVTLTTQQIPQHNHLFLASSASAGATDPTGQTLASPVGNIFNASSNRTALAPQSIGATGGSQPHENMQPYLCINFIISMFGVFPSQT